MRGGRVSVSADKKTVTKFGHGALETQQVLVFEDTHLMSEGAKMHMKKLVKAAKKEDMNDVKISSRNCSQKYYLKAYLEAASENAVSSST